MNTKYERLPSINVEAHDSPESSGEEQIPVLIRRYSSVTSLHGSGVVEIRSRSSSLGSLQNVQDKKKLHGSNDAHGRVSRKPYHYPSPLKQSQDRLTPAESASYNRFLYYSRLRNTNPSSDDLVTLLIPDHVLPPCFIIPYLPLPKPESGVQQSSLITIFVIWNTIMGTSILTMPWALKQAGLVSGISAILIMGMICFYTAYRIINLQKVAGIPGETMEFANICSILLGKAGEYSAIFFSVVSLFGAACVYWVLLSNFLFNTVSFIHNEIIGNVTSGNVNSSYPDVLCPSQPVVNNTELSFGKLGNPISIFIGDDIFDKVWTLNLSVPLFLVLILGPLVNFKEPTILTKFNSLGTISILYLITFLGVKVGVWKIHADFVNTTSDIYIPLLNEGFPALTGTLSMSYFIHNCIITIMKNNQHPQNNNRDLAIAFSLVIMTYLVFAVVFYLGFPLAKDCIVDNFLNNFHNGDIMTSLARMFLLFQMTTVFPLLMYVLRSQLLYALFNKVYPGPAHMVALNIGVITMCVIIAIFLPEIGTILRFFGAFAGLALIFTLPSLCHIVALKRTRRLTNWSVIFHVILIFLGATNFLSQFVF